VSPVEAVWLWGGRVLMAGLLALAAASGTAAGEVGCGLLARLGHHVALPGAAGCFQRLLAAERQG